MAIEWMSRKDAPPGSSGPRRYRALSLSWERRGRGARAWPGGFDGWGFGRPLRLPQQLRIVLSAGYTLGWVGPSAFSKMARARWYSGSASASFPSDLYSTARLLRVMATSG